MNEDDLMLNRKLKKLIIGGCMLVMAGTVIGGCGTSTQTTSNKLIVGTNATFVPFEFKDEKLKTIQALILILFVPSVSVSIKM